jgi:hypothetical protein
LAVSRHRIDCCCHIHGGADLAGVHPSAPDAAEIRNYGYMLQVARSHYIDILCGYLLRDFQTEESSPIFERICVAHSAAYTL